MPRAVSHAGTTGTMISRKGAGVALAVDGFIAVKAVMGINGQGDVCAPATAPTDPHTDVAEWALAVFPR